MGILKNELFNNLFNKNSQPAPNSIYRNKESINNIPISYSVVFEIAGLHHYKDNISKLATPMKKWKMTDEQIIQKYPNKKIYKNYYINEPVLFVYEPTNPYDVNAIKVFINNIHVGYVPKSDCISLKKMLETSIVTVNATISGGEYKIIFSDGQKEEYNEPLSIKIRVNTQRWYNGKS